MEPQEQWRQWASTESLGDRVRRLRHRAGLSQDALARAAGVTKSHVYQVEKSLREHLRRDTLVAYAAALGVTVEYLKHGDTAQVDAVGDVVVATIEEPGYNTDPPWVLSMSYDPSFVPEINPKRLVEALRSHVMQESPLTSSEIEELCEHYQQLLEKRLRANRHFGS